MKTSGTIILWVVAMVCAWVVSLFYFINTIGLGLAILFGLATTLVGIGAILQKMRKR